MNEFVWLTKNAKGPKDPNYTGVVFGRYYISGKEVDEGTYQAYSEQNKNTQAKPIERKNDALDDFFNEPTKPESKKPDSPVDMRKNDALDDFFGDAPKDNAKKEEIAAQKQAATVDLIESNLNKIEQDEKNAQSIGEEIERHLQSVPKKVAEDFQKKYGIKLDEDGYELMGRKYLGLYKEDSPQAKVPDVTKPAFKPKESPKKTTPPALPSNKEGAKSKNGSDWDWMNESGFKGPKDQVPDYVPPLPKREDSIPRPRRSNAKNWDRTGGVSLNGQQHMVSFNSLEQKRAFAAAYAEKNPEGATYWQQQKSKEKAKLQMQKFADKHFGGDVAKARTYAHAEYDHITGKLQGNKGDGPVKVGRMPPKYRRLPPPLPSQEEGKKPTYTGPEPPPLPSQRGSDDKTDWNAFWNEPDANVTHEQTQQSALEKANAAMDEARRQRESGDALDHDQLRRVHKDAWDAINEHEKAGHQAIDQMAIEKYGYTEKAKQVAHQSKRKFSEKLGKVRDRIKKATYVGGPPGTLPNTPPPLPGEKFQFDWNGPERQLKDLPQKQEDRPANDEVTEPQLPTPVDTNTPPVVEEPTPTKEDMAVGTANTTPEEKPVVQPVASAPTPTPVAEKHPLHNDNAHNHAPVRSKNVHPDLAASDVFKNAHPYDHDDLRDIHANNLARSSKQLEGQIHKQNRRVEIAKDNNSHPDEIRKEESIRDLLYHMHGNAKKREEAQAEAKQRQREEAALASQKKKEEGKKQAKEAKKEEVRQQEKQRVLEEGPGRVRDNKMRTVVGEYTRDRGIDPGFFKENAEWKDEVGKAGILHLIKNGGHSMDEVAQELESAGYLRIPEGRHGDDYLMELLINDDDHAHANYDDEYAHYEHQHAKELEAVHNDPDITERQIAEATRIGQESGLLAFQEELASKDHGDSGSSGEGKGSEEKPRFRSPEDGLDDIADENDQRADDYDRGLETDTDFRSEAEKERDNDFPFGYNDPDYRDGVSDLDDDIMDDMRRQKALSIPSPSLVEWHVSSPLLWLTKGDDVDLGNERQRIDLMADILGGLFGKDALKLFGGNAWVQKAWNSIDHPRGKNGRFIPKGSPESFSAAQDSIAKILNGKKDSASHKNLMDHLSILTVKQLHEIKKKYNLKASGKTKDELVKKIGERLGKAHGIGEKQPEVPVQSNEDKNSIKDKESKRKSDHAQETLSAMKKKLSEGGFVTIPFITGRQVRFSKDHAESISLDGNDITWSNGKKKVSIPFDGTEYNYLTSQLGVKPYKASEEYINSLDFSDDDRFLTLKEYIGDATDDFIVNARKKEHREMVELALKKGEKVPENVLSDYKDLIGSESKKKTVAGKKDNPKGKLSYSYGEGDNKVEVWKSKDGYHVKSGNGESKTFANDKAKEVYDYASSQYAKMQQQGKDGSKVDLKDFAGKVMDMAENSKPEQRYAYSNRKVFISELWKESQKRKDFPKMSLDQFKDNLMKSHVGEMLTLARADLVLDMDPAMVDDSEIKHMNATYHFVTVNDKKKKAVVLRHNPFVWLTKEMN